jgi:hypothetical protein
MDLGLRRSHYLRRQTISLLLTPILGLPHVEFGLNQAILQQTAHSLVSRRVLKR